MYYIYILKLSNNAYYVGSTSNLKNRIKDYHEGSVRSTKSFRPIKLVYCCAFPTKTQAIKFELYLKSGSGIAFRRRHLV